MLNFTIRFSGTKAKLVFIISLSVRADLFRAGLVKFCQNCYTCLDEI